MRIYYYKPSVLIIIIIRSRHLNGENLMAYRNQWLDFFLRNLHFAKRISQRMQKQKISLEVMQMTQ